MEAFDIAIDPIIFSIGAVSLRWYGLLIAVAIAIGIFVALREARRRGVDEDAAYTCALWSVVGAVIGARLLHVLDRIDFYLQNPVLIVAVQQGGLAIWGAIFGGLCAGAFYASRRRLSIATMADIAAPALLIGQIIGRLGSIINGDAYGIPVDLPWSYVYMHQDSLALDLGEPTHPFPLYDIIWNTIVLGAIWRLRLRSLPPGALFLTFLTAYSIGRFILSFVRDEQVWFLNLQQAHIMALLTLAVAIPLLVRVNRQSSEANATPESA